MARPSVFFPDLREVCITLFNSHTTPARMNNIQKFFDDNTKQTTDPATSFKNPSLNQSKLQTMLFAIYSMLFLEYRTKIGAVRANSQSTMAVVIRNMQLTGPARHNSLIQSREETTALHWRLRFPAMSDAGSNVSELSKYNYKKIW